MHGRHADHDARADQLAAVVRALDEVAQHRLGDLEVGDHAVLDRADRAHVAGRPAEHLLGLEADGADHLAAPVRVARDGDDARLRAHEALALDVHERVGRAEVDREIVGEQSGNRNRRDPSNPSAAARSRGCVGFVSAEVAPRLSKGAGSARPADARRVTAVTLAGARRSAARRASAAGPGAGGSPTDRARRARSEFGHLVDHRGDRGADQAELRVVGGELRVRGGELRLEAFDLAGERADPLRPGSTRAAVCDEQRGAIANTSSASDDPEHAAASTPRARARELRLRRCRAGRRAGSPSAGRGLRVCGLRDSLAGIRTGSPASTGSSCAGWSSGSCGPARRPSRCPSRTDCCR